jgi:surfactin synthase thioesterase subunit
MGAFVACEAGLIMQNEAGLPPKGVVVSGQNPPYAVHCGKHLEIPDDLYEFAKKLGGVPQKILDNPKMCERLIGFAQADLIAVSNYAPTLPDADKRLSCGMLIRGADDFIVDPQYLGDWDKTFREMHSDNVLAGDHFYFNHCPEKLVELIDGFAAARC